LLISCGRRGDPVPITPSRIEDQSIKDISPSDRDIPEKSRVILPPPPTGLTGLYTEKAIILTWDEIKGKEIKGYNIYRSSGEGFKFIGKTITPAFTDSEIIEGKVYLYRVTAIAEEEGPPSKEIEIVTKTR